MPTSRMDAAIWAYFGVFLTAVGDELERLNVGDRDASVPLLQRPSSPVTMQLFVPCQACAPASMRSCKVAGQGVEPLGAQQRHEILVGEQLAQGFGHEDQSIARGLGLADQKALAVDVLLIGPDERVR